MRRTVRILPDAEIEILAAMEWYERQRRGLGLEFELALDAAMQGLSRHPQKHAWVGLRTRRLLLRRFPYLVLYVAEGDEILVTAVFHVRRDPARWSDRLRESAPQSRYVVLP